VRAKEKQEKESESEHPTKEVISENKREKRERK
jgi:hypothetical protein